MDVVFKLIGTTQIKFYYKEILEYLQENNFDAAVALIFATCAVYYFREELYSQGRFRWRNLGLEFSWTLLGFGLLIECVILVLYYIAGFFSQGEFIWYTCCFLIGFVLEVFIIANCIKAKLASQNEAPSSEARIANQGENARPCPDQTSSTETGNEVNFPTGNETPSPEDRNTSQNENESPSPVQSDASETIDGGALASQNEMPSPEDRSASQSENERPSSGQNRSVNDNNGVRLPSQNETASPWERSASQNMRERPSPDQNNARDTNNGRKIHHTVLNRCCLELVRDLDWKAVHRYLEQKELFDDITRRDILEQPTTTEKNQYLINRLKERDGQTYANFKECLVLSGQKHLKEQLEKMEEVVTLEME